MISYEEALATLRNPGRLKTITLPVGEASGYVAARDVTSEVLVPPFANSAMDGFAVYSENLADASKESPVTLPIAGSTVAGDTPCVARSGAWEIMTGAPVPQGYDAVVKIEDVAVRGHDVTFMAPAQGKNNMREAGEDFLIGDAVVHSGTLLTPYHVMALATVGHKDVTVYSKPNITIFSTGKELIEEADSPLLPGQIRNANGPYLMAALQESGFQPSYGGMIADDPTVFETRIRETLSEADILISTGAVSAGRHDFIPECLRKLGAKIVFHKVAIRPGKPVLYARFPDGTHYFGLPGNPVSAAVGLRFFVVPLLRHLQGMEQESPITARLLMPSPKKKGLRCFRKSHVSVTTGGRLQLEILHGQESFKIHPMLRANCWASFAEDQDGTEIGAAVQIYPLMPGRWGLGAVS